MVPLDITDKNSVRREFDQVSPHFEALGKNLKEALYGFLKADKIDFLDVYYRTKQFEDFFEKIDRKEYDDPFTQMPDICGVRVICYYPIDLAKIRGIIVREFNVLESIDKTVLSEPDRFGYRSDHYVVTVKDKWSHAPNYRGLEGLKAEIQVRTILMHAWADIEHKLAYKKKEHIPQQFRRRLSQISALLEVADERFESLKKDREQLRSHLILEDKHGGDKFDLDQPINLDTLQAFLDIHFPDRDATPKRTLALLDELTKSSISFSEILQAFHRVEPHLAGIEKDFIPGSRWQQTGIVRAILDVTSDKFWTVRRRRAFESNSWGRAVSKWRDTLKDK